MPETIILESSERMDKALEALKKELALVRTGRANPAVLNGINVEYYGVPTPINQIASISVPEAQQLLIKPYDKSSLKDIEKAIQLADLNLTPLNDGQIIRINFPALTEQRRKELAKDVKAYGETAKIAIRNIRRDANDHLKKLEKDKKIGEDDLKFYEQEVQETTDKHITLIDEIVKDKEQSIMVI